MFDFFSLVRDVIVWSFLALLLWAAWGDYRRLLIPNGLCFAILLLYVVFLPFSGLSLGGVAWSVGLGGVLFAFGALLFARGLIGGGDVKLMAVTALWAGPAQFAEFLFLMALAGGLLAVVYAVHARIGPLLWPAPQLAGSGDPDAPPAARPLTLPYGIAIAAAGVYVALTILGQ